MQGGTTRVLNMYVAININIRMKIKTRLSLACQDEHDIGDDCACEDGKGDCDANCDGDCGSDGDGCGGDDSSGAVGDGSVENVVNDADDDAYSGNLTPIKGIPTEIQANLSLKSHAGHESARRLGFTQCPLSARSVPAQCPLAFSTVPASLCLLEE